MPAERVSVSRAERLFALRTCSAFDELTAGELWRIGASLRARQFAAGDSITLPGMPLAALEFIVKGRVNVRGREGHSTLGPRNVIGDLAELLDEAPAPRATATEATLTLEFDRAALEDLLEDDFSIFLGVLRSTARRLARSGGWGPNALPGKRAGRRRKSPPPVLDLVERVLLLQQNVHLGHSEIAPLATLAEEAAEFVVPPGAPLFPASPRVDHFVILVSGIAVVETRKGRLRVGAGEVIGMLEGLAGESSWPSVTAETALRGLRIGASSLIDVIEDYPSFGLGLLRALAHGIEESPA